jgi:hypothetical protein
VSSELPTPTSRAVELLGGRDYLSYSAVGTYQQCPLRFLFKYVLGLPEATVAAPLLFGQAMHKAVQHHFEQLLAGNPASTLDVLLEVFWDAWHSRESPTVLFGKTEDVNAIGHLADRLFAAFLTSDFSRPAGVIVGVEEELRGALVPGCPDLLARVDLLVDTGDTLVLSDFKTSRTAWSEGRVTDAAPQVLIYNELAEGLAGGKALRLQFAVLTKAKAPALTVHQVRQDAHQINRTKRVIEQVWRAIEAQHFYPIPSAMNCPTCPFQGPCRQWAG